MSSQDILDTLKCGRPEYSEETRNYETIITKNERLAIKEITRLREENARLLKENSELMLRAHALLWLLPPEITCGELQKARDEMLAATIREGGKDAD